MDYALMNSYKRLKSDYQNIIKTSADRRLVQECKLKLKLLEKKFLDISQQTAAGQRTSVVFI